MVGVSTTKGFYDEPYRAPAEQASPEDARRAMDRTNRRIDILFNRQDRQENVDRIAAATTLTEAHRNVFVDTDSAAITITLPAGVAGQHFRIVNTGTSSNLVTITPNGTELLLGVNSSFVLFDGESLDIVFEATEGWA